MRSCGPLAAGEALETRLELAGVPEGWAALAGLAVLGLFTAAVILLYRAEQRAGSSPAVRRLPAALRCLVLLLLALAWLEPVLATSIRRAVDARTIILIDRSASMNLRDRYAEPGGERLSEAGQRLRRALDRPDLQPAELTRRRIAESILLSGESGLLRRLAESNTPAVFDFADNVLPWTPEATESRSAGAARTDAVAASRPADGPATDIGQAIRTAVESDPSVPVAAVVVFSDGRFNRGEPADVVARYAREKRIAVWTVGIGDPAAPRNVAIAGLEAPAGAFVDDPVSIQGRLRVEGAGQATVTVELAERSSQDGTWRVLAERQVVAGTDGSASAAFRHRLSAAGPVELAVRVRPLDGETLLEDNAREFTVRGYDNQLRVLIVAGSPGWDFRYLLRLLERDRTVNVSGWLQSADADAVRDGNTVIDHLPRGREELDAYDAVVLMDPDPGGVDEAWAAEVAALVARSGLGLLYAAGAKHTPSFVRSPQARAIVELLPVAVDAGESDLMLNEMGHFQPAAWPPSIPPPAAAHPVLAMSDDALESRRIWSALPGVYWHYPVQRLKPAATLLLESGDPRTRGPRGPAVLLATHFAGTGRTGFLAFDGTWRWRLQGDRCFNRFWIQLLRHLVEGRLAGEDRRGMVRAERDRYQTGETVIIEARLAEDLAGPGAPAELQATVDREGHDVVSVALSAQPGREGWYRGHFQAGEPGRYGIRLNLPSPAVGPAPRGEVRVVRPDLEFREVSLDKASLRLLASQSAGGQYLEVDEAGRLADLIPSRRTSTVVPGSIVPLWDRWWVLALIVGLLAAEWTLRKRLNLL